MAATGGRSFGAPAAEVSRARALISRLRASTRRADGRLGRRPPAKIRPLHEGKALGGSSPRRQPPEASLGRNEKVLAVGIHARRRPQGADVRRVGSPSASCLESASSWISPRHERAGKARAGRRGSPPDSFRTTGATAVRRLFSPLERNHEHDPGVPRRESVTKTVASGHQPGTWRRPRDLAHANLRQLASGPRAVGSPTRGALREGPDDSHAGRRSSVHRATRRSSRSAGRWSPQGWPGDHCRNVGIVLLGPSTKANGSVGGERG